MPGDTLSYLSAFFKDLRVASVTPTSTAGIARLLKQINFDRARVVVEFGPGTGVISRAILDRLPPESHLLLIERNLEFIETLQAEFQDPRVLIHHGLAQDARRILTDHDLHAADYVLSGIPFSLIEPEDREAIVAQTHALLQPDGAFLAYQFLWQPDAHLYDLLFNTFNHLDTGAVFRNIPPLRVFFAHKGRG